MSKFVPSAYRSYLRMSKKKHILVEGKEDKAAMLFLLTEIAFTQQIETSNVSIETAEQIISSDGRGVRNREKVLDIARSVAEKDYKTRFMGFVDREFDGFEIGDISIEDRICCHRIDGRALFSRGHSIENYLFEIPILGLILESQSTVPYSESVLSMYENVFEEALFQACSLSLAVSDLQLIDRLNKSIDWKFFQIQGENELCFLLDDWLSVIIEDRNISTEVADLLKDRFIHYLSKLERSADSLPRWLCHGHIGMDVLYSVYCACLLNTSLQAENQEENSVSHIGWVRREKLFSLLVKSWAKKSLKGDCEYPADIVSFLGSPAD